MPHAALPPTLQCPVLAVAVLDSLVSEGNLLHLKAESSSVSKWGMLKIAS